MGEPVEELSELRTENDGLIAAIRRVAHDRDEAMRMFRDMVRTARDMIAKNEALEAEVKSLRKERDVLKSPKSELRSTEQRDV
jgi:uncharacterized coiled-coil DUF342 family protein